ncbi:MAG: lysophospholipid acyltransferase family protein [Sphaerochaetaceae bacterium]
MSKKPLFIRLAQPTYGSMILKSNKIQVVGMHHISELKPPFVVMANHAHTYDPFFISSASPIHIRWVAGAYLFKMRGLRTLMEQWIGAIAKQQGRSDLFTIRAISESLKQGDVVGVFPEGTRTWDGEPAGFDEAIAKLVKIFKVPIVLINLEGVYGLKPRRARKRRKGSAILKVLPPLFPDVVEQLSVQELYALLQQKLYFSYRSWQKETHFSYVSKYAAEGAEQVLYLCPDCHAVSTITTKGKRIQCKHCSLTMELDTHDRLSTVSGKTSFEDIAAWHTWQRKYSISDEGKQLVYPPDKGVLFQTADQRHLIRITKDFTLSLEQEGMRLRQANGKEHFMAFSDIQSMIINAKNTVELYHHHTLYRIRILERGCILKYVEAYQHKKQTQKGGIA